MARKSLRRLASNLVFFVILAGFLVVLLRPRVLGPEPSDTLPGIVHYVYDGDTLEVADVGKVRLIGIDAMDGHNAEKMLSQSRWYGLTTRQVEHWAEEATSLAAERLQGRAVVLHLGLERLDEYGRTLAYVHVPLEEGDLDLGLLMLERGLAATYRKALHPRREEYMAAEHRAQAAREGMWQDARVRP